MRTDSKSHSNPLLNPMADSFKAAATSIAGPADGLLPAETTRAASTTESDKVGAQVLSFALFNARSLNTKLTLSLQNNFDYTVWLWKARCFDLTLLCGTQIIVTADRPNFVLADTKSEKVQKEIYLQYNHLLRNHECDVICVVETWFYAVVSNSLTLDSSAYSVF
jgi:hypothetical protein